MPKTRAAVAALATATIVTVAGLSVSALAQPAATRVAGPSAASNAPLTGDLATVQAHLLAMRSLTADFTQTDRRGQTLTGTLMLKQPGKIRFQYQRGVPMLIVADGRSLNVIDYDVRQVQRWPIANSPLAALIDPQRRMARYGRLMPTQNANTISVEIRDPARPEYGMITMIFERDAAAPAGLRLYGWVALDAQHNRTTIRLSNVQYNVAIADSAFRWTDPRRAPAAKK